MATPKKKRAKGTGGVIKQASGNYAFQFKNASGKRVTKSLKTKNRKEAELKALDFERGLTARDTVDVLHEISRARELVDSRALPLLDTWGAFLATNPTAGAGTLKLYQRSLKAFKDWLTEHRPSIADFGLVDSHTAADWLATVWGQGVSASTYNDKRGALALIYKELSRPYKLSGNPFLETVRKKGVQQKRLSLSRDQIQQLLEVDTSREMRAVLFLGLFAGMRLGDAVFLKVGAIRGSILKYTPAKTSRTSGAVVQVPLLSILSEALKPYLKGKSDSYLFPEIAKRYLKNPDGLKLQLLELIHLVTGKGEQLCAAQSLRKRSLYGFHSLRHSFATEAARAGVDTVMLQLMTGDTMQTLQKYYVQIAEIGVEPAKGFDELQRLLSPNRDNYSERDELKRLADSLPITVVVELIALANTKNTES